MSSFIMQPPADLLELGKFYQSKFDRAPGTKISTITTSEDMLMKNLDTEANFFNFVGSRHYLIVKSGRILEVDNSTNEVVFSQSEEPYVAISENTLAGDITRFRLWKERDRDDNFFRRLLCLTLTDVNIIAGNDDERFFDVVPSNFVIDIPIPDIEMIQLGK